MPEFPEFLALFPSFVFFSFWKLNALKSLPSLNQSWHNCEMTTVLPNMFKFNLSELIRRILLNSEELQSGQSQPNWAFDCKSTDAWKEKKNLSFQQKVEVTSVA